MNSEGEFWIHLKLSFWFDWFVQEIIQKLDQNVGTASVDHNTADSSSVETADVAKKVMIVLPKKVTRMMMTMLPKSDDNFDK